MDKVVDTFAVELEVEARILEGGREFDYGLADFVYLFLGRDLADTGFSRGHMSWGLKGVTNHNLELFGLVREDDRQGEDGIWKVLDMLHDIPADMLHE